MTLLFEGEVAVHYGFIYFNPVGDPPTDIDVRGQSNGLCSVPEPDMLIMITGLHTGAVPLVVEVLEVAPPVENDWEEVVEVSMATGTTAYELTAFDTVEPLILPASGSYRVRFNASGMDSARQADVRRPGEPVLDSYRLQLWLAPPQSGAILRQTSQTARYWHGIARGNDLV